MGYRATAAHAAAAACAFAFAVGTADAAPFDNQALILNAYNLVTSGDVQGQSHVQGRAYVGGNLTGGAVEIYASPLGTSSDWADLIVGGRVAGSVKKVNNGGDAWIGGDVEQMEFNAGSDGRRGAAVINGRVTGYVNGAGAVTEEAGRAIPDLFAGFPELSAYLAGLAATGSPDAGDPNNLTFDAPAVNGISVYDISAGVIGSGDRITVDPGDAGLVVINVSGTDVDMGRYSKTDWNVAGNVLWNFHQAISLDINRETVGAVLAPGALVSLNSNLEGSLVARSLNIYNGELHPQGFTSGFPPPAVPLPAAAPLLAGALAGLAALARRRRG